MDKDLGAKVASSPGQSMRKPGRQVVTCEDEIALIGTYISSDLGPELLALFQNHLENCRDCAAFLQTYKKTIAATRKILVQQFRKDLPPNLVWRLRRLRLKSPCI